MFRRLIPAFLVLFAICYYGSYYRCSLYPAGEGGVEGVIALRLLEGKTPFIDTILNYNLFWFYPIVGLFKIFGPSYTLLRIFFFFLATFTGLLSFYVVRLTTKRVDAATLAGLLTLILPGQLFRNYMGFLVMLNMASFLKAFLSPHLTILRRFLWIGIAGLALSLTFLIRIDLGFFLSLTFIALILFFPSINRTKTPCYRRLLLSLAALLVGILSFLALHLPVYLYAEHHGFSSQFADQYHRWPHLIVSQTNQILKKLYHSPSESITISQSSPSEPPPHSSCSSLPASPAPIKTTLLRRSLFSSDPRERLTALNLYLPILSSLLLILMAVGFLFQKKIYRNPHQQAFQILTGLGCSLTLFPQYFFWRPDMVHLSEFMVPMMTTTIFAIIFAWEAWFSSKLLLKIICFLVLTVNIITLLLYFINGCQSQSTGGIAIREGRTKEFVGLNGIHVKLKPEEWEETSAIYHSILSHSNPQEYVVCFPYNPEINFMTNRRSYRFDLYCDDITARTYFDKVAIQEIETFHPAVIVINNWPINGTEHSRFSNWAKTTYDYICSHYVLDYSKGIIQVFIRQ